MIDTEPILSESAAQAAAYFYDLGKEQLQESKTSGDKLLAQEAHFSLQKIGRFYGDYKEVHRLLEESNKVGTFHVLLKVDEDYANPLTLDFISRSFWVSIKDGLSTTSTLQKVSHLML